MRVAGDQHDFVEAVLEANREIYLLCMQPDPSLYTPLQRGEGGDVTHRIDQVAEEIFVKHLRRFGGIYSEESGMICEGETLITIDPLDGSDNFLSNFPYFGTSIAKENENGDVVAAVVVNLATGAVFLKTSLGFVCGDLFDKRFHDVQKNPNPKIGIFERAYCSTYYAPKLKKAKVKYRVPGAMALSLALAHEVAFVIVEGALRTFDVRAGLYMCEGLYQHKTNDLTIICQNKNIFDRLRQILLEDER